MGTPVETNNQHQHQQPTPTTNMKSFVSILFLNIALARPDHGVLHHGAHHGVHHQPVAVHHTVHHHQPSVHHTVHHQQPTVHHAVHHQQPTVHHAVHQPMLHHAVHHNAVHQHQPVHHNQVAPVVAKVAAKTIAELVVSEPRFSTLLAAVKAADLVDTLNGEGAFTVFAPTNEAFKKVPEEALTGLLADKEALKAVLLRHVVPSSLQGKNIPPGTTALTTAGGEEISVRRDSNNLIQLQSTAGSAYVVLFDVIASNGVAHAVDSVF